MSAKRLPSPSLYYNPQKDAAQMVKMQDLLQQYDRQNSFLNKQILDLLKINKLLGERKGVNNGDLSYYKQQQTARKQSARRNSKRYEYLAQADQYYKINSLNNSKRASDSNNNIKTVDNWRINKDNDSTDARNKKKVQFTKDPYIQNSDTQRDSPSRIKKSNSQSPIKKAGIEIMDRSLSRSKSKDKLDDRMNLSNLSKNSMKSNKSRKSGISVVSKQSHQSKNIYEQKSPLKNNNHDGKQKDQSPNKIDLPMTTQKKVSSIKRTQSDFFQQFNSQQQLPKPKKSNFIPRSSQKCIQTSPKYLQSTNYKQTITKKPNPIQTYVNYGAQTTQTDPNINTAAKQIRNFKPRTITQEESYKEQSDKYSTNGQRQRANSVTNFNYNRSSVSNRHQITPSKMNMKRQSGFQRKSSQGTLGPQMRQKSKKKFINVISKQVLKESLQTKLKPYKFSSK